ncbi:cell division protein FtsQ/DivIB [Roseibium limicola]|uniref:Cell division protein FtsQ n=1 Tax=Roseibium limicola TaxID=2816037 RepID=A0A939EJM1_9HYPH|nr:cell division protein FtsQ/DivIB [Roseibium limicola]MBO0343693.1 cell division protein FtsQ/DivIB [Roseibium limicola]
MDGRGRKLLSIGRKNKRETLTQLEADLAPRGRGVARLYRQPVWRAAGVLAECPRGAGTLASAAFLTLALGYGIVLGGHGKVVTNALLSASGFGIEAIKMSGQSETDTFQILEALEIQEGSSLVLFDADGARARLNDIPWIRQASVMKLYPGTLQVSVEEKVPYALWQRGDHLSIITDTGEVITDQVDGRYANLLLVLNHGAQHKVQEIQAALDTVPGLRSRVRAAELIGDRRWDLVLENGITVRLPEEQMDMALAELTRMDAESGLLTRDITMVDLRLNDRVVVKLTPDAMERQKSMKNGTGVMVKLERDT